MSAEKQIGPYTIQRPVSRWTLAERFLAKQDGANTPYLLDRLWPELKNLHGFEGEIEHIAGWKQVKNAAIPAVIDAQIIDGHAYVVSETFEGRSLESLLQRQLQAGTPLPKRLVLELGLQLSSALTAIHEATDEDGWSLALTHGAVHPTRVMLDKRGRVRLIGGWGSRLESRLAFSQSARHIVYQAPEVLWGSGPHSARSDLFSLGVMLYEGWALKRFEGSGEDAVTTLRRILKRGPAQALSDLSLEAPLMELLTALLDTDPNNRPENAREVSEVLGAFLNGESRPAKTAPAPAKAAPAPAKPAPAPAKPAPAPAKPAPAKDPAADVADPPSAEIAIGQRPAEDSQARAEMVATTVINQAELKAAAERAISAAKEVAQTEELRPDTLKNEAERVAEAPAEPAQAEAPAESESEAVKEEIAPAKAEAEKEAAPEAEAAKADDKPPVDATQESGISAAPPPVQPAKADPPLTYTQEQKAISPLILQQELETGNLWGFLVYREGSLEERRYALSGDSVTLGRSSDNHYQILREIKASRRHCMFEVDGDQIYVIDRRSTNGTHLNGQPVTRAEIHGGEKLTIGYTTLKLLLVDEEGNEIGAAQKLDRGTQDQSKPLPKAFLTRYRHSDREQIIPIEGEIFMIGRNKDMDLTLKDRKVAPSHCQIRVEGNQYVLEDHLSEHGTLVNGFLVDQIILDGNEDIQIGDQSFQFEVMRDHNLH